MARPSASSSAVWKESASRVAMSPRTTMRSTTTSMSCLSFLSRAGASAISWNAPSILTRWKPLHQLGQLLAVLALAAAHDRRQQVEPRALGQRQHPVDHLRHGLALDRQAGRRRIGHADAGEQQPHVVVDLGDRADGRARVAAGGLLLDRDGRRQAVDLVDVRLLHHLQELAGIGRQPLDVAALALGIDRVEGERRLARARQAGQHDQLVARQVEVDVLEIVLARAADRDELARGRAVVGHGTFSEGEGRRRPPPKLMLLSRRDKRRPPSSRGKCAPATRACCQCCQAGRAEARTKKEQTGPLCRWRGQVASASQTTSGNVGSTFPRMRQKCNA